MMPMLGLAVLAVLVDQDERCENDHLRGQEKIQEWIGKAIKGPKPRQTRPVNDDPGAKQGQMATDESEASHEAGNPGTESVKGTNLPCQLPLDFGNRLDVSADRLGNGVATFAQLVHEAASWIFSGRWGLRLVVQRLRQLPHGTVLAYTMALVMPRGAWELEDASKGVKGPSGPRLAGLAASQKCRRIGKEWHSGSSVSSCDRE